MVNSVSNKIRQCSVIKELVFVLKQRFIEKKKFKAQNLISSVSKVNFSTRKKIFENMKNHCLFLSWSDIFENKMPQISQKLIKADKKLRTEIHQE